MKRVTIGIIGSGFAADLHAMAYKRIYGLEVCIKAVASVDSGVNDFVKKYDISDVYSDYKKMLLDKEIDMIDIITPPNLHTQMVLDVLHSGKHVICEKPLTGYFGKDDSDYNVGSIVKKSDMYESVLRELQLIEDEVKKSNCLFMYAENFVYAPAVQKSVELIEAKKSKILFMRAEESHSGSHAKHAAHWKYSGGGSFIRQGCHPLSAVLYLKNKEAKLHGKEIYVKSILADTGVVGSALSKEEHKFIESNPIDVEDIANVILTFSDDSKAIVMAGDMIVGGVKNLVEVYTNEGVHYCNIAPNNVMPVYHADESGLEDVYITEKVGVKAGWQNVLLEEELMRGYIGELQDFTECVAYGRNPESDFGLAKQTIELVYAAYQSAEEGKRIEFNY